TKNGDLVEFKISGDGFLYNMVRIIVGTLLQINDGQLPKDCICDIIKGKDRKKAGKTALAHGLYLNRVFYDEKWEVSDGK
ncbi:MAG: tRNA pseudouridine(38-40) synthase TruA, partial [Oscillospiraceae bacterium]|nr:tRNA pseudouridine(38-40) synthase TruA [Oscillospiraceae bacterium]